uniref:Apple domain-containing protein n=1 Tax=Globisporangium ultimum (strain ATCC 200006 / CBS 805.95 / DAOM BR144) TaxID=431595 RepID=K3WN51_GLOUD
MSKDARIQQGTILNNVDFAANDILSLRAATAEECMDKCNEYQMCHAFSWTPAASGSCYLKTKRSVEVKLVAPNADGSPSVRSGTSYKCTPLLSNTDNAGKDLQGILATTPQECCGICRANSPCGAFSWSNYNGGTCWLKEAGGVMKAGSNVYAASLH